MHHRRYPFVLLVLFLFFWGCSALQNSRTSETPVISLQQQLTKIDSLDRLGLYRSAADEANELLNRAIRENHPGFAGRALDYSLTFSALIDEDHEENLWPELKEHVAKSSFPTRNILAAAAADWLWNYYQFNQWRINDRKTAAITAGEDVREWTRNQFYTTVADYLDTALTDHSALYDVDATLVEPLFNDSALCAEEQNLLDLITAKAQQFYLSPDVNVQPLEQLTDNPEDLLGGHDRFQQVSVQKTDQSYWQQSVSLFQSLGDLHVKNKNEPALANLTVKRLKEYKKHLIIPDSDSLYLQTLTAAKNRFKQPHAKAIISYALAEFYEHKANQQQEIPADSTRWYYSKALGLCDEVIAEDNCPEHICRSCTALNSRINRMVLNVTTEKIIPPGQPWKSAFHYRNISESYFAVVPFSYEEYREILSIRDREEQIVKIVSSAKLRDLPHRIAFDDEGDYRDHTYEMAHDFLSAGFYLLIAAPTRVVSFEKSSVAINPIWVSEVAWSHRLDHRHRNEFRFVHRITGEPITDLQINVYEQSYNIYQRRTELNKVTDAVTNESGQVTIVPPKKDQRLVLEVLYNEQSLWVESFYHSGHDRSPNAYSRVHFFTDRKVYRPGQTVHFKGIVIRYRNEERKVLSSVEEKIELLDVNGKVVQEMEVKTNEYGSFHGSFKIPEGGITGNYQLQTSRGSHFISVEEYKRPTFQVALNAPDSAYRPGDWVTLRGVAENLAGFPLQNAEVNYRVERAIEQYFWRGFGWPIAEPAHEIAAGKVSSDGDGSFSISFRATANQKLSSFQHWRFTIYAEVVDISGESHGAEITIRMGGSPMILHTSLHSVELADQLSQIKISATNVNGDTIAAKGTLEIRQLQMPGKPLRERLWSVPDQFELDSAEHAALFPNDVYQKSADISNAEPGATVFKSAFDTSTDSAISLTHEEFKSGWYVARLVSVLQEDSIINEHRFTVVNDSLPGTLPEMLWSFAEDRNYKVGDSVQVYFTGRPGMTVWLEKETAGKIVSQQMLELSGEMQSVKVAVEESDYGNFGIHLNTIYQNRHYSVTHLVQVPYRHKKLKVELQTVRDHLLPGAKDEWSVKISGADGEPVSAELLAGMYDASLDALGFHNSWNLNPFTNRNIQLQWSGGSSFVANYGWHYQRDWNQIEHFYPPQPCELNFGGNRFSPMYSRMYSDATATGVSEMVMEEAEVVANASADKKQEADDADVASSESNAVQFRSDFSETAFFIPELTTDSTGNVFFRFILPESVTTWKWLLMANTRDLKTGSQEGTLVASKPIMVIANAPRFVRENDQLLWTAQVVNQSEKEQQAKVALRITNFDSEADLSEKMIAGSKEQSVNVKAGSSVVVQWPVSISVSEGILQFSTSAQSGDFSDGEIRPIAVLPQKMLVTETMPITLYGDGEYNFTFNSLKNSWSDTTREHHNLAFEFSSNPVWYAVQALPYLMERPHEGSEQVFSRLYANTLARHIVDSKPAIAEIVEQYKASDSKALLSNLEKNQELKRIVLEETPWLVQAENETEAKRRIAVLFDEERILQEQQKALQKLAEAQLPDGSWPWFNGMRSDRFITQYIAEGFGRLKHLGINMSGSEDIIEKAIIYLDQVVINAHDHQDQPKEEWLSAADIHYLYLRSFFQEKSASDKLKKTTDHIWKLADSLWTSQGVYTQAMLALAAHRSGKTDLSDKIVASLNERSVFSPDQGRYWKLSSGAYWYQQPVETQSMLIALYSETGAEKEWLNEMKVWLLNQKRVQNWTTSTATAGACYALLMEGDDWLRHTQMPTVSVGDYDIFYNEGLGGDYNVVVRPEPGTGYFKTSWKPEEIEEEMANVKIEQHHDGPAWGAMYWQYFQDMDLVESHQSPLSVDRSCFVAVQKDGKTEFVPVEQQTLSPGDRLVMRVVIETEMDLDYVHLKARRAAGLEPVDVKSGYRFDSALGYYLAVKDEANHYFFSRLPKGKHIFEYELRVNLSGDFASGPAEIQSMYAPEFAAQSKGWRVKIK